jgi:hypothetical protein
LNPAEHAESIRPAFVVQPPRHARRSGSAIGSERPDWRCCSHALAEAGRASQLGRSPDEGTLRGVDWMLARR